MKIDTKVSKAKVRIYDNVKLTKSELAKVKAKRMSKSFIAKLKKSAIKKSKITKDADLGYFKLCFETDPTFSLNEAYKEYLSANPEVAYDLVQQASSNTGLFADDEMFDYDTFIDLLPEDKEEAFTLGLHADHFSYGDDYYGFDAYGNPFSMSDVGYESKCVELCIENIEQVMEDVDEIPEEMKQIEELWNNTVLREDIIGKARKSKGDKMKTTKSDIKKKVSESLFVFANDLKAKLDNIAEMYKAIDGVYDTENWDLKESSLFDDMTSAINNAFAKMNDYESYLGQMINRFRNEGLIKSKGGKTMKATVSKLTKSKGIKLKGYNGTWKVVKSRGIYSLLESEQLGKRALNIVLKGKKILKEVDAESDKQTKEFFNDADKEEKSEEVVSEQRKDLEPKVADGVEEETKCNGKARKSRILRSKAIKRKFAKGDEIDSEDEISTDPVPPKQSGDAIDSEDEISTDPVPPKQSGDAIDSEENIDPMPMTDVSEHEEPNEESKIVETDAGILDLDSDVIEKMRNTGLTLSQIREQVRKQALGQQSEQVVPSGHPYARIGNGKFSNKLEKPEGRYKKV